ncbi:Mobile element protein (plasmid) [Acidithiobacillus caldus ATCC 51756]|uniref:Mobile element protein n=1 Tax=Acidithiobacillus caldus (strain ATCC 51756 / DSM 8584 / KU) TaxID=637389 RepID=A0A059ZZA8_ACICK|nr:Mobile element protein [Acidithiobacillus caldus ATCC 51756]
MLGETQQQHEGRVMKAVQVNEWLPWVDIDIGNLWAFLLGMPHGISAGSIVRNI